MLLELVQAFDMLVMLVRRVTDHLFEELDPLRKVVGTHGNRDAAFRYDLAVVKHEIGPAFGGGPRRSRFRLSKVRGPGAPLSTKSSTTT